MHCTDAQQRSLAALALMILISACSSSRMPDWPSSTTKPAPVEARAHSPELPAVALPPALADPGTPAGRAVGPAPNPAAPNPAATGTLSARPVGPAAAVPPAPPLPPPRRARSWAEFKLFAAQRMVAANKSITNGGAVPDPLLAIPVLEVELNADGSVRRITVSRKPTQAEDTVQMAIDAVRRAAPFGDVSHLPRPWKFTEVFLFDDDRRFKPRTLDF